MRKFFLLLFIFACSHFAFSQQWGHVGTKWTYEGRNQLNANVIPVPYESLRDTVIQGVSCNVIYRTGGTVANWYIGTLPSPWFYEDSGVVYNFNYWLNKYTVFYDLNKDVGEKWEYVVDSCPYDAIVTRKSYDTINGIILKTMNITLLYISGDTLIEEAKIIERIGFLNEPSPNTHYACEFHNVDDPYFTGLRCYEDSVLGFVDFGKADSCNYIYSGIKDIDKSDELKIYPNPFNIELYISSQIQEEFYFEILDIYGRLILKGILNTNQNYINTTSLKNGTYFFRIPESKYRSKLLIKTDD